MKTWVRTFVNIVVVVCMFFSVTAIFQGDVTSAPANGFCKISNGENLNDVHSIMQNKDGDIYTLGYTCVQKFNRFGKFVGGAYYSSNSIKHVLNNEFLSLNDGKILLFDCLHSIIYVFDNDFDIVEKIEVESAYDENDFYLDYPNTDANDKDIRLSFFNNTVLLGNEKIQLEAPRNRLFSRDIGLLLLMSAILTGLGCNWSFFTKYVWYK